MRAVEGLGCRFFRDGLGATARIPFAVFDGRNSRLLLWSVVLVWWSI